MTSNPSFQIPGEMLGAIKTRSEKEWMELFERLTTRKLAQIPGCANADELIRCQAGAKEIQSIGQFFIDEMRR